MTTATLPIATTTTLSILLHGVAVAVLLTVYDQIKPTQAVGQGVDIELVSSTVIANQHETDVPHKQQVLDNESLEHVLAENQLEKNKTNQEKVLVSNYREIDFVEQVNEKKQNKSIVVENNRVTSVAQSTNTSQQKHAILELLHSRIGDNKSYPYLARRQRREGVSTIAFVLYPDGSIENTRLITSSQTIALDRAALSAVKGIVPFTAAQDYLEQAEMFKVDVIFSLL